MSLNDFAVQLYLTLLAIAAAPILLSWGLRRIAGKHAPVYEQPKQEEDDAWQREWDDVQYYWPNWHDKN
jgi:membrane-bound acyltransferase YfiQ involved in biofilm formation